MSVPSGLRRFTQRLARRRGFFPNVEMTPGFPRIQYPGGRPRCFRGSWRQPGSAGALMKILTGGCRVYSAEDGRLSTLGNWTARTVISQDSGAQRITLTVSDYAPGLSPAVVNPGSEEVLYVASGEGKCCINGFEYTLSSGAAIFVPPRAVYNIENTGVETLRLVCSCCPEDRQRHIVDAPPRAAPGQPPLLVVSRRL